MSWTDERIEKLTKMWEGGSTASQIAEVLGGVSRNAVIGKAIVAAAWPINLFLPPQLRPTTRPNRVWGNATFRRRECPSSTGSTGWGFGRSI